MVQESIQAANLLLDIGITAEIIDPISLVPLDVDTILKSVSRTGRLLVVDSAWTMCGASAEIIAAVVEQQKNGSNIKCARMGFAPTSCPTTPSLEQAFYPNPVKIAEKIYKMVLPNEPHWAPDPSKAQLAYQIQFRGPF